MSEYLQKLFSVVREMERQRESQIWCMIHSGEEAHMCGPTKRTLWRDRGKIGHGKKIEVLLHSPGGHPQIGYMVMKFFRSRFDEVNVIVPIAAKSAATLMCLGADTVFMGELAELGPIDIQINDQVNRGGHNFSPLNEFKSLEFLRDQAIEWMDYYAFLMNQQYGLSVKEALRDAVPFVTGLMRPILEKVDPVEMGGHRRDLAIAEEYARRMLSLTGNPDAARIVRQMVWEYPSHDFHIDHTEAGDIGLPVKLLSEQDDLALADALQNLENEDSYEGFTKEPDTTSTTALPAKKSKSLRANGSRRSNGSEAHGK